MKKLFTLASAGSLALLALGAQAQITLDGKVDASEIATTYTSGKYQLVSSYTGTHSVADHGLKALYIGTDATKLYIAVVGSLEQATTYPGIVAYFSLPGKTGVAAGTQLAGGSASDSPLKQKPTLDFAAAYGFRLNVAPTGTSPANGYLSYVDYSAGNPAAGAQATDTYQGSVDKVGTVTTATATTGPFLNWKAAYITSTSLAANTANSAAEFSFDLANLGLTATNPNFNLFVAYVNDGGIFTSDTFPPITGQTAALSPDQNFTAIAGNQYITYRVGTGALASKAAAEAVALGVFPNPATDQATVSYKVAAANTPVHISLVDLLGRTVRVVDAGVKGAGDQSTTLSTASLTGGTYLLRVQVGDNVAASKLTLL